MSGQRYRLLSFFFVLLLLLGACSSPTPEELASLAAKGYYDHLLRREFDNFLAGKAMSDSLPEIYREQLKEGYKQFMAQQDKEHHGILSTRVVNAKADTSLHVMNVFLMLCFGDSTIEEIVVPMVDVNGSWRMK